MGAVAQPQVRPAQQPYKNVQVLRDLPPNQMTQTMHLIQGQIGVECQFCHIWEEWEREDKPMKQVARRMLAMVASLNKNSFGGAQVVTCYTCHRGSPTPVSTVILPVPRPPSVDNPPPAPVLPMVDEILRRYVQSLGGEAAVRKVTTRVVRGKRDIPTGPGGMIPMAADVEMYQKTPNLTLNVYKTEKFTISDGFDGTAAWSKNITGNVVTLQSPDQSRTTRGADFYAPLNIAEQYTRLTVVGIERVNGRDAYVVVGTLAGDTPERLYFDVQNGLLLRRATTLPTGVGTSPYEVNYEDYRVMKSGARFPFLIRMNPAGPRTEIPTTSTFRVLSVRENVALDDALFGRPSAP